MNPVVVAGVGMTRFGKFLHRGLKDMSMEAIQLALKDSDLQGNAIQAAYVGNSVAGITTGQEMIRGQVVLNASGIVGIPIFNIENACASSSTALHLAWVGINAGMYECVLVLGVEKMTHPDKMVSFRAFESGIDIEEMDEFLKNTERESEAGPTRSIFMDIYANTARRFMQKSGATMKHFAQIAAKNHSHGSLNPYAQYQTEMSVQEVLQDRLIVHPLTRAMCAPISDGAAAVILCSQKFAQRLSLKQVYLKSSVVLSTDTLNPGGPSVITRASRQAYELAGITPQDIDVLEIHDATASAEMMAYEELGLCEEGDSLRLVEDERTAISGETPVNPSGGLECKGHPIGATGVAQIVELVWQLRGKAGKRQISRIPKVALAQNAGGHLGSENAVASVSVLTR